MSVLKCATVGFLGLQALGACYRYNPETNPPWVYGLLGIKPYMESHIKAHGFKGFSENMTAHGGYKFTAGCVYVHEGHIKIYNSGFHYGTNPRVALNFYDPDNSVYHHVVDLGTIQETSSCRGGTKVVTNKLFIGDPLDGVYGGHRFRSGKLVVPLEPGERRRFA